MPPTHTPSVSVLMPTYRQSAFLPRALCSLLEQTLKDWEAIVVDASDDSATSQVLAPWLRTARFRCIRVAEGGLGRALNIALDHAQAPLVACLPSDDVYYRDHLQDLKNLLDAQPHAVLAYSGVRHHYSRASEGQIPGEPLQLVQCMHRRSALRWVERDEMESDDLERLYWRRLRGLGEFPGRAA